MSRTYVPPGVVHRHFNASDTEPVDAIVLNPKLIYLDAQLVFQRLIEPPFSPGGAAKEKK